MKIFYLALFPFLLLPLTVAAQQQIYKTTDEQGNTVFTDAPPTDEAKPVQLESPNIADSVEVRPYEPTPAPRANSVPAAEPRQDTPVYVGGDDNLREEVYEAHRKRELRERAIDAENGPAQRPKAKPTPRPLPAHRPAPGRR